MYTKGTLSKSKSEYFSTLVDEYTELVSKIAHHLCARMPASVSVEDLVQSGMIGLLEAAQKYDQSKGASFETFAGIRIRGSMIDEIRKGEWSPRSVHKNLRTITSSIRRLEQSLKRPVTDREIANDLELDILDYYAMSQDVLSVKLFSLQDVVFEDGEETIDRIESQENTPLENTEHNLFMKALEDEINCLSEKEQLVLALYYDEEMNLKEIAEILGVSESRISQIHSQAALKLRGRLLDWKLKYHN